MRIETKARRAYALKDYRSTLQHLQQLSELVGPNPQTLYMTALCFARMSDDEHALECAHRALTLAPEHLACLQLLGDLYLRRDEAGVAAEYIGRGLLVAKAELECATWARASLGSKIRTLASAVAHWPAQAPGSIDRDWVEWATRFLDTQD